MKIFNILSVFYIILFKRSNLRQKNPKLKSALGIDSDMTLRTKVSHKKIA